MASDHLFSLHTGIQTRWASMENPDGAPGCGGQAQSGRKGAPACALAPGETLVMAHATGMGTVRRLWMTICDRTPAMLRGIVLRMYWDGMEKPAVEAPLGDFFCQPLGQTAVFENAWFDNPEGRSFNCRIPMPFRTGFKITATNESPRMQGSFFYDVNYTVGQDHDPDTGYFHAHYRRENPTRLRQDFAILPRVRGRGRFLGCSLGVIANTARWSKHWWGEGEVKMYLDGDRDYPTLCGTGTEDYIGTGWGQGRFSSQWHGCPIADEEELCYGFYRLHGPDPIYFQREVRVTIQQIGWYDRNSMQECMRANDIAEIVPAGDGTQRMTPETLGESGIFEREDDWCATTYFYLDSPVSNLPPIENYAARIAGLSDGKEQV